MLGLEGTYGRMNKLAKDELYQGRHVTLQEIVKAIDRISPDQILQISQRVIRSEGVCGDCPRPNT